MPCAATGYNASGSRVGINVMPGCTVTLPVGPPAFARSDRYNDWAIYLEDSFRVTPRLTLNYGLRYEHYGVQHNNNQALDSNLYYGPGSNVFAAGAIRNDSTGEEQSDRSALGSSLGNGRSAHRFRL